jgi:hypothetical protein
MKARWTSARGSSAARATASSTHPFERALTQLAEEQTRQKLLLDLGGPGPQTPQEPGPFLSRALAADPRDFFQGRIHVAHSERRRVGARYFRKRRYRGVAHAESWLTDGSGEVGGPDLHLCSLEPAQECRQQRDFVQPSACGGDSARGLDQVVEGHHGSRIPGVPMLPEGR